MGHCLRVFIGFDPVETVAYNVLQHSIQSRASKPVTIAPISLRQLGPLMRRPRDQLQSTDFSFSRFLTPYLSDYDGWSLFIDCDMLVVDDIASLFDLADDRYAVMVVKHDHRPKEAIKFLGSTQTRYEKKNWSSVMLVNNAKCRALTPDYVNTASGLDLHQFKWLEHDDLIGELPHRWGHLVGYDETVPIEQLSLLHFTVGGPYFSSYRSTDYADAWFAERERMLECQERLRSTLK
ncbi:hypothetical protein C7405_1238 [Paraburkholderia caballeronis]|uniref:glycosyltransferase n=1 Tax=Paraburkholderia caballeronis TaxID=416943 RepID=UPI001064A348|nr:glycosyltransferase [Paraburkholderia caballeronis]TDV25336.1 hypothetical protein C7405_1238 [Paraburkholderia caballeronis]